MEKAPVLRQSICNEPVAHQVQKIYVETTINDKKKTLLKSFPDVVEGHHGWASRWHVGRDPNAKDRYVDEANENKEAPFEQPGFALVNHDQGNTVGDDLRKKLGLNRP